MQRKILVEKYLRDPFHVSRLRAAELKGNGLVTIIGEVPDNKMNRAPENKG